MLTKKDRQLIIQDLKATFLTKDDAKTFLTKEDAKQFATKNDVANFKDEIVGRFDKINQELTMTNGYDDQLEDYEICIKDLEKASKTA